MSCVSGRQGGARPSTADGEHGGWRPRALGLDPSWFRILALWPHLTLPSTLPCPQQGQHQFLPHPSHPPTTPHLHVRIHFQRKLNIWGLSSFFSAMKQKSYLYEFKGDNKYIYYNCLTVLMINRQGKHLFLRSWKLRQSSTESRVYKRGGGGATGRDGAGRRAGQQRRV